MPMIDDSFDCVRCYCNVAEIHEPAVAVYFADEGHADHEVMPMEIMALVRRLGFGQSVSRLKPVSFPDFNHSLPLLALGIAAVV
jgi:hypothetical protein